jgi:predicted RNA-binding Zn-ribbon protein involved in translation (DUF1610 family)
MKRLGWIVFFLVGLLLPVSTVLAEDPGFEIRLNRDFGYGGMGNQIQGRFSIIVKDDLDFLQVTYMMDDTEMGVLTEAPFRFSFSTDDFVPGNHEYWAIGVLSDGTMLESNRISANVLTAEEANVDVGLILGIIFGTIIVGGGISWVITTVVSKRTEKGEYFDANHLPKGFNLRGGTICPKCGEAYAYHVFSANLLTHKFDRCPHCGKFSLTRSVSRDKIIAEVSKRHGEDLEIENKQPLTEEEKLRKQLEESKFLD